MPEARKVFSKIGYKKGTTTIHHFIPDQKDKIPFESDGMPLNSFFEKLGAFSAVCAWLPVDEDKYEDVVIKSVSLKEKNGSYKEIIVTGTFTMEDKPAWNFNTPNLQVDDFPGMSTMIDELIVEAEKYLNLERGQIEMDLDAEDNDGTETEAEAEAEDYERVAQDESF